MNLSSQQENYTRPKLTDEQIAYFLERRTMMRAAVGNQNCPLSRRETEVLRHLVTGKARSKIAKELFIDVETVKSHIKAIYRKMNVHYKADAIRISTLHQYI